MIESLKAVLYFPIAWYFRFFAEIRLRIWNPRVIVVTGSNGKTTLLHMLESQIGKKAKYSHHANSAFGIPFDILDLHRKTLQQSEWINLFLSAPFAIFKSLPKEKLYIVEADADRPDEGKFLASLLRPECVLWVSTSRTHSMNFDRLVKSPQDPLRKGGDEGGGFANVEEAIAFEYGYFLAYCSKFAVIDGDSDLQKRQQRRTTARVVSVEKKDLQKYEVTQEGTAFTISGQKYSFAYLLPQEIYYSIAMCEQLVHYLDLSFDSAFTQFSLPSGRGSVLNGIKKTILIDSSYNANLASNSVLLHMFAKFPAKEKWVVISDMLELGNEEKEEHERLAELLNKLAFEKVVLVGSRIAKYTFPLIKKNAVRFQTTIEARDYLLKTIKREEAILFKGSQSMFLEGIIESLLADKKDGSKLPRRGDFWEKKRAKAGL